MMNMQGKRGVVLGVLNKRSIAASCASTLLAQGASVICSYMPSDDDGARRLKLAQAAVPGLSAGLMLPYDATCDRSSEEFFRQVRSHFGEIDFLVHAISMVPAQSAGAPFSATSRADFLLAMAVGVHSMIGAAALARPLMAPGSAMVTLSYLSSDALVPGYGLLGICKAALESAVRYLSQELGEHGIRVNTVSAAPFASSASLANPAYEQLCAAYTTKAPLGRQASVADIVGAISFLLSDASSGMTGERLFVDGGFHHLAAV